MKLAIFENLVICGAIVISFLSYNGMSTTPSKLVESEMQTVSYSKIDTIHPAKTVNIDSLLMDAKQTIKLFNKSELDKLASNKKEVSLLKSEISLNKEQTRLTKEIIGKLKKKIEKEGQKEMVLQMDSVCVETNKGLNRVFNGKKCKQYDVTYFVVMNNKRYNLNKD